MTSAGSCGRSSARPTEGSRGHDEITESWMHIEIDTAGADVAGLEDDLRRVLADVRVAVEDYPKMQGQALRLATQLGTEGATGAGRDPGAAALAGRQSLHLPRLPRVRPGGRAGRDGAAGGARHRPGHLAARQARLVILRRAAARGARAGQGPAAAHPDQGQLPVHRAPALLPGLHRDQADRRERRGQRRVPVPRPLHACRLPREHHPDPGAAAQAGRACWNRPGWPRTATTART